MLTAAKAAAVSSEVAVSLGELPVKADEARHLEERPVGLLLDLGAPILRRREPPIDAAAVVKE